ncbi:MAG: lamin tail domain-containing protein [Caldilineaceae bacterium]|nr:lamin tail domain-containing protein [Caldilineaceae bacterium]
MRYGVRLHFVLVSSAQGRSGRAPALGFLLAGLLLWFSGHLSAWAQPSIPPRLIISEVHPAPHAVGDEMGEWIELFNLSSEAVNLQFWSLTNQGGGEHVFPFELWIPPGGYLILARQQDPAQNGGVQPAAIYTQITLANQSERLSLHTPENEIEDSVAWGEGTELTAHDGASLERSAPSPAAPWVVAHSPWPGSAGDLGSPGAPYRPPPTPTPLPPSPTPPPTIPPRLFLSEIMADPRAASDEMGEWIELYNGDTVPVNLDGWRLRDQDTDQAILSGELWLPPGGYALLARTNDPALNGGVVVQMGYTGLQLANEQDELLLVTPWGLVVDQLVWGDGTFNISTGASLERTGFDAAATWATAHAPWPGSAGDLGSPGAPYIPPPEPMPTATPLSTVPPAIPPRLLLSEIMANPAAVGDDLGEWIEIYNGESVPVNLDGWILADQGSDRAVLAGELWLAPGGYALLARVSDPTQNGGVPAQMGYSGLQLANQADELILITPWGVPVDQLIWGEGTLKISNGASLERTSFEPAATWTTAHAPWPGSAGDLGSPGAPYTAPPAQPTPTASATAMPSPTALPIGWGRRLQPSPLIIAQVYAEGSDQEYIVLRNSSDAAIALAGWRLGDAEVPGDREGLMFLPESVVLSPGASWIVARSASTFRAIWGRAPDAEWGNSDPALPQLLPDTTLAAGEMALADEGDELLLFDPDGAVADAVAWKDGSYANLGLAGHLDMPSRTALFQAPGAPYPTVSDLRHRFMLLPPDPFGTFSLPSLPAHSPVALDGGMIAQWGSLGAASTFSPGGTMPPHILLAAAGALGLDFTAIADSDRAPADMVVSAQSSGPVALPAWRWHHPEGHQAIVYSEITASLLGWGELYDFLAKENVLAQLPPQIGYASQRTPLLTADNVSAPGNLADLQALWQSLEMPLLPAGNSTPPLPGASVLAPHYTGLAATDSNASALLDALGQRRGWLTSSPGLWLTLHTEGGEWMGSTVAPAKELTLHIAYGDSSSTGAGLALWQDDQIVRQLDLPPTDGRWTLTLPAAPGTMLYAVATQLDGDFAITAPIFVAPAAGGAVLINEVLPAPGTDHNGDGQVNSDDEFIELFNSGSAPLSLAGYSLGDAASATGSRRFTFGSDRFIGAGERLLLWRANSGLSLNDDGDFLDLLDANGTQVDRLAWEQRDAGASLSRIPDGGDWQSRTPPTPGHANQPFPPPEPTTPPEPDPPPVDPTDVGDPQSPNFGQATGPPGSVALAKLRGLETITEFTGQVIVPPGLFPSAIYVADAALDANGVPMPTAGLGIQVYLRAGEFMPMQEGDWLLVRGGVVKSFRGEMEIQIEEPGQAWSFAPGTPLVPLPITVSEIGESLEGRLVSFSGLVTGWQGDSIFLGDPANPDAPPIRVTIRASLGWRRPYVQKGEQFQVTGIVGQFGKAAPWNDGYRVLLRFESDLVRVYSSEAAGR